MGIKIIKYIIFSLFLFLGASGAKAEGKTNLYFFYGEGCPHCAKEEVFLDKLQEENKDLNVLSYEVWSNEKNAKLLSKVAAEINLKVSGVPVTIVGDQAVVGFQDEKTTGVKIRNLIEDFDAGVSRDVVDEILSNQKTDGGAKVNNEQSGVNVVSSIFGDINLKNMSLPLLTVTVGLLDSLNPCAMWVLLFLISLMLGMNNRKRMWILGGAFIFGSAAAYFVFLSAWLNIYLFISYLVWIKVAIILLAIIVGSFNLNQYWKNRNGGCEVSENENKRKIIISKITRIVQSNTYWLALVGIVILAAGINMVELLCSAGLPAVYIPLLTEAGLVKSQYYFYLLVYSFFYVLIQIIVFLAAMYTLEIKAVSSKITKWSNLIGGVLMILIGLYLISKWGLLTLF